MNWSTARATEVAISTRSFRALPLWRRSPSFLAGAAIVGVVVAVSVGAPLLTRYDPTAQDLTQILAAPSRVHWLGTDHLGRDVWTRLLYGGRTDLQIAFIAVLFPFVLGTFAGAVAGYFGGWVDVLVTRLIDVVVAFPFLILIIALAMALGPGTRSIYIAITVVGWVSYARIIRGEILVAKRQDYVAAAKVSGLSAIRIIGRHLLPNVITQAIVFAMSDIVLDILAIVTLGYLGLGVPPPTPDWGTMIADGQAFILSNWILSTTPGIFIIVTGLGLSLLGDGLSEVLSPP